MVKPSQRREMAQQTVRSGKASIRLACLSFSISTTCYRYQPRLSSENTEVADQLIRLTHNQRNCGFGLCFLYLRNVKGYELESQAGVPDLSGAGAEPADQAA